MRRSFGFAAGLGALLLLVPSVARAQYQPPPQQGYPPPQQGYPPPGYNQGYRPPPPGYRPPPGYGYSEPPPPPRKPDNGFQLPEFSVRIDPFNWILQGRLGVELESQVWKFISAELVPVFMVNSSPPDLNLRSVPSELTQHSNGLGPISGTSIGAGFWLDGKPFEGTVLRVIFTNYGYSYKTDDGAGNPIDQVDHTERRLFGYIGSHARWGFFTIAGGIGLGVELNNQQRCFNGSIAQTTDSGCKGSLLIALDKNLNNVADLNGPLHPAYLMARLSLGFVF